MTAAAAAAAATTTTKRAAPSTVSLSSHDDLAKMKQNLPDGPMRFAPTVPERTMEEQIQRLKFNELECYEAMVDRWDVKHPSHKISSQLVLRYVRNSPSGEKPWDKKAIWKLLEMFRTNSTVQTQINLTITDTIDQLRTKTLFPVPGLKTKDTGLDVFYMKPSRYSPHTTPASFVIDNLAYTINTMLEKEHACTNGIAFVANMNDWTMHHFGTDYCLKFMKMLQGRRIPVQVQQFLIVNPPKWFNKVWAMMKPMLTTEFQRKVRMIPESKLSKFLAPGYASFLPDDMVSGKASTDAIVQDYIAYRLYVEQGTIMIPVVAQPQQQSADDGDGSLHNNSGTTPTQVVVSDDTLRSSTHQGEEEVEEGGTATAFVPPDDNKVQKPMTTSAAKTSLSSLGHNSTTAVKKKKRRFWSSSVIVRPNT